MKTIFIVQGYDEKSEDGSLKNVVTYEVYAKDDKEAIKKAKKYCDKPFYRVSQVIEK